MNQADYFDMSYADRRQYDAQQFCQLLINMTGCQSNGLMDINASTETAYPVKNGNSMNKKLEAAKKWLKERKQAQTIDSQVIKE